MIALGTTERVTRQLADGGVLGADAVAVDIPWLVADHGLERYVGTGVAFRVDSDILGWLGTMRRTTGHSRLAGSSAGRRGAAAYAWL